MKYASHVVFVLLLCLTSSASGQVSIQLNDMPMTPGAVLTRSIGANFNLMTAAGPDQSWDFSASVTVIDFPETWDDPEGNYGAEDFPTANLVMYGPMIEGMQQFTYFQQSGSSYWLVGAAYYYNGEVVTIPSEVTGVNADFPLQYGDEWDFVSVTEFDGVVTTQDVHHHIDAWGTVTDITGTFDCIRMRVDRTTTEVPGDIVTQIEYYWYAPGYGEVVSVVSNHNETDPLFESGSFMRISDIQGWIGVDETDPTVVRSFELLPAYPNPFNASTTLTFTLDSPGNVSLAVMNSLGQQVALVTNAPFAPGTHQLSFDGHGLSSGTYFVRLVTDGQPSQMQRITLLK